MTLFTLKKIISLFFMPLSIAFILVVFALFFLYINKIKKAKLFLTFGFLWLFLISYQPFSNALIKPLEIKYPSYLNIDSNIKYVLVLGNAHKTNKDLSDVSQLSGTALKRLSEGIRIYKKLDNAKLIVSGYGGDDITPHAIMAKNAAISLGVSKENILMQEKAKDTFEEALYAKKIIGDDNFILVTSASHMPRAMKIFKSENLNAIAAPTDYLHDKESSYLSFPKTRYLNNTTVAIHEYLGSLWFKVSKIFRLYVN